ncbi:LOW QUALITY PROTEIN: uncharacterized protein Dyak_GE29170 [Drosophila yakuba]|uniref:Doublecortin-like and CAM kinase-like protein n=1 Tax=Drosophila yakuba TaxID=7245 RepID=A0A0R1E4J3_DROYA|nr:LOW QUALITY PROTEIN: uncharacterized protein Dyak_GE29170 [Drosophila yakuba]
MSDQSNCFDSRRLCPPLQQKALRVCFLRNGDRHFKGVNMAISRAYFKDLQALLQGVTQSLERHVVLRSVIEHFCRTDGSPITSLSSFRETDIVICCCKNEEMVWLKYSVNKDFKRMMASCKRWRQRRLYSGSLKHDAQIARSVMRCTVSALAHMHQLQVIHRDIKPENLRVCFTSGVWNFEMVKVGDFGLATYYLGSDLYTYCGTPGYMAPEMIAMSGYDHQVDSWSLGVTLFYMLCGQRPFACDSQNASEIYAAIMSGGPSYPKDMKGVLSPEASQLIDGLLVSNPIYRSTIAELGQHPFSALSAVTKFFLLFRFAIILNRFMLGRAQ